MAYDNGELHLQAPVRIRLRERLVGGQRRRRRAWTAPEDWTPGDTADRRHHARPRALQRDAAGRLPLRQLRDPQGSAVDDRQRPRRALPEGGAGGHSGRSQGGRLPLGHLVRRDDRHGRHHPAAEQGRDPGAAREGSRADRQAVPAWSDDRGGASQRADRDLDQGHRRGRQGHGDRPAAEQPALADDLLRCPRQHAAAAADRGHPWSGGQPQGRDHPAADQVELPRGSDRAGVLHLHARCP